jgi:hypothetical protein
LIPTWLPGSPMRPMTCSASAYPQMILRLGSTRQAGASVRRDIDEVFF